MHPFGETELFLVTQNHTNLIEGGAQTSINAAQLMSQLSLRDVSFHKLPIERLKKL